jgi:malate dehydrogenase (oxaloacetate-decarboxylating)
LTIKATSTVDPSKSGTAVVTLAALINALKLVKKDIKDISLVISGAGAAGIAIIKLLIAMGLKNVVMCDRSGALYKGREGLNSEKVEIAEISNLLMKKGSLNGLLKDADVFIGVSAPDTVTQEMVRSMAKDAILFPMANPIPEIMPDLAIEAGAAVVGTGRSDFPNQINNVLAFPGIFRGALDVRASDINDEMKIAAAYAIAELVSDSELKAEYIIPAAFDPRVRDAVAKAVAEVARKSNVARI